MMRRLLFALALFAPAAANAAISFTGSSSSTTFSNVGSVTLSAPAGAAATDVMVAVIGGTGASRTTNVTVTAPAGSSWVLVKGQQDTTNFGGLYVFWALGTETAFNFTVSSNTSGNGFVLAYSGVDNTTPLDVAAGGQNNTTASTTETAPTISTVTANTWLVGSFLWFVTGTVALPTYSAEFGTHRLSGGLSAGRGGSSSIDTADLLKAATGASGTKTVAASSSQRSIGVLLALRPGTAPVIPRLRSLLGVGL